MPERLAENLSTIVAIVAVASVLVGGAIVSFAFRASRTMKVARDQIINYLKARNYELISFDRIRERIDASYSDRFLESLPGHFPNDLRKARLRGGRSGLGRIMVEDGDERISLESLQQLRDVIDQVINRERERTQTRTGIRPLGPGNAAGS